ncbi:MAG: ribonuclease H-like domain-containing protein [Lachnospiraceae bacterium]|nr:ribonuclease H-like domain-containing protein [Lachnospiraceae bacterium]
MKKIEYKTKVPECLCGKWKNGLLFDIETTGFHREREKLYLIGAGYVKEEEFILLQWFCDDGKEEVILEDFLSFSESFTSLIHYNGLSFDLPFLEEKAKKYGLSSSLLEKEQVDLYREIRPYKNFLNLNDLKLPTVEQFFLMERKEQENGKSLIPIYKSYLNSPTKEKEEMLLQHNYFDIIHLTALTQIVDLKYCLEDGFQIVESQVTDKYLRIRIKFSYSFPKLVQGEKLEILYSFYAGQGELNLPLYSGSLKYYYENYKDYYYLPHENMVIHKSVAAFVDVANKEKCTAKNCFVLKEGVFLKQYEPIFEPVFQLNYKEKETYFPVDSFKDSKKQYEYIKSVLRVIVHL